MARKWKCGVAVVTLVSALGGGGGDVVSISGVVAFDNINDDEVSDGDDVRGSEDDVEGIDSQRVIESGVGEEIGGWGGR